MAELWPNYAMNYLQKYEELVLHGRIMADILAGGRIVAESLKPTGQNVWTGQGVRMVDRQSTSSAYPAHLRVSSDRHQFRRNVRKNTEPAVLTIMNDDSGQAISIT